MLVPDLVRDSFIGQVIYYVSGRRLFRYPEEKPGFVLSPEYSVTPSKKPPLGSPAPRSPHAQNSTFSRRTSHSGSTLGQTDPHRHDLEKQRPVPLQRESSQAREVLHVHGRHAEKAEKVEERQMESSTLVDWYGSDDSEFPGNVCP